VTASGELPAGGVQSAADLLPAPRHRAAKSTGKRHIVTLGPQGLERCRFAVLELYLGAVHGVEKRFKSSGQRGLCVSP
jgi:hypothetical protein